MTAAGLHLTLRADATSVIGAGHCMRLAVLAQAWLAAGGTVGLRGLLELPFVVERYARLGIGNEHDDGPADVLVVDSYDPTVRFHATKVAAATKVLVDDLAVDVAPGFDAIWNPNAYASADMYRQFAGPVLSGPEFLAIRDDVPAWRAGGEEIVVSLGGSTPPRQLAEAMRLLAELAPDHRFAMTGAWAPDGWRVIAPEDFWAAASHARQLITAAGTTVWEAARAGVPVALLMTADNQRLVYRWGRDAGVPGINTMLIDAEFLAHQLKALIGVACALPAASNGAPRVVERLARLARAVRSSP